MKNSIIHPNAKIGKNVKIGDFCKITEYVEIDDNVVIGDYSILGVELPNLKNRKLYIGANSIIRSHNIIYEGSYFKEKLETGHNVLIRENTISGINLRIGSFSDIEGDCEIGDYVRFHSYVHIGKGSKIGNLVWIYSLVTLTNDPLPPSKIESPVIIEDGVVISVGSTILPGTLIKTGAFIGANSLVGGVVEEGEVIAKQRDHIISHVTSLADLNSGIKHPWMNHFYDRYPDGAQKLINDIKIRIIESRKNFIKKNSTN